MIRKFIAAIVALSLAWTSFPPGCFAQKTRSVDSKPFVIDTATLGKTSNLSNLLDHITYSPESQVADADSGAARADESIRLSSDQIVQLAHEAAQGPFVLEHNAKNGSIRFRAVGREENGHTFKELSVQGGEHVDALSEGLKNAR